MLWYCWFSEIVVQVDFFFFLVVYLSVCVRVGVLCRETKRIHCNNRFLWLRLCVYVVVLSSDHNWSEYIWLFVQIPLIKCKNLPNPRVVAFSARRPQRVLTIAACKERYSNIGQFAPHPPPQFPRPAHNSYTHLLLETETSVSTRTRISYGF